MRPTALCIGGPLDGERRGYAPGTQYMVYVLPWPLKQVKVGEPHPNSVEYDKCMYRIELLGDVRKAVTVLIHSGMSTFEALEQLVARYPAPSAAVPHFADFPITVEQLAAGEGE